MSKLAFIICTSNKSNSSLRTASANLGHGFPCFLYDTPRHYFTESTTQNSAPDSFPDYVYAKVYGITKYTLKTDIISLLEGCNLALDDVKVQYNTSFSPISMMVQFSLPQFYNQANRIIAKRGILYGIQRIERPQWDMLSPYDGKTVLLTRIPRNALREDVERFLSGCQYNSSSLWMISRPGYPENMATVCFPSETEAMNCFITKNRGFCLNNQILVRVLQ